MGRSGIEQLTYAMTEAFDGSKEHSLLANLRSLNDDDWSWLPPGGVRSIFDIVQHIGECKYVYENHAFGDSSLRWDRPKSIPSVGFGHPPQEIIDWLREGQRRLLASVAGLADDGQLIVLRPAPWGASYETRWLLSVTPQHDLYHGGEINHIRALRQGNDAWAYAAGYDTEQGEPP